MHQGHSPSARIAGFEVLFFMYDSCQGEGGLFGVLLGHRHPLLVCGDPRVGPSHASVVCAH